MKVDPVKIRTTHVAAVISAAVITAMLAGCSTGAADDAAADAKNANSFDTISDGVLRVGTVTDNRPYSFIEDGVNAGLDIDLLKEFADRNDLEIQFVQTEFASLIPNVVSGQLDLAAASISITAERQKIVDFTDDVDSLAGVRLGLIQGTIQDSYAQENGFDSEIVRFPDNNSGVAALKAGSIDGFFMDAPLAETYVADDPSLELPIVIFDNQSPYGIAFSKDNTDLTAAFDADLKELITDGTLAELQQKWLPSLPVAEQFKPVS
jgi:polar amino acid transport system substrate-binding protein